MNGVVCYLNKTLNNVISGKVFYISNVEEERINKPTPYIIFQERPKRNPVSNNKFSKFVFYKITLVTKCKDSNLEKLLESKFDQNDLDYQLVTEFINIDDTLNTVYEIRFDTDFEY